MTYRRAVIPALAGALLLTLLLWWAGQSAHALQLPGSGSALDAQSQSALRRWLIPWSYDPPAGLFSDGAAGGDTTAGAGTAYGDLYRTAMQIRFVALFVFYLAGALLLVRRIPPVNRRTPGTVLALWAWGPVAATVAVTLSAPWLIASGGHGSFRFLPQLAAMIASGGPVTVGAALVTAVVTVLVARVAAKGEASPPRRAVPPRAARIAASAGTAVIALSLVVLSYESVAAWIQTSFPGRGVLSEPGDLLREWLLLGGWSGPSTTPFGHWLLYRAADAFTLAVVWWALRLLPGLLTRITAPAMMAGGVCATVLGLLASQIVHMAIDDTASVWGPVYLFAQLGSGVPAALTTGTVAGVAAWAALRLTAVDPSVGAVTQEPARPLA
ncbi:hypothetical protein ACFWII_22540 [Streptomyces sp. NPDC127063]|uniref:hypothetical protein n=1 Tax=Streptomyces sp. NPDC127063 TaxID=3347123 RepID=UPI003665215C